MSTAARAALAGPHQNELLLFDTLLQLTVIVLAGRLGGAVARRCGQSAAVGEIVIGILLGPSLFGWLSPRAFDTVFPAQRSFRGAGEFSSGVSAGMVGRRVTVGFRRRYPASRAEPGRPESRMRRRAPSRAHRPKSSDTVAGAWNAPGTSAEKYPRSPV